MKAVIRRLRRLEDQFKPAGALWRRFRVVVRPSGSKGLPGLQGATCQRTLCPDGTLMELICSGAGGDDPENITEETFEAWVDSFPVTILEGAA